MQNHNRYELECNALLPLSTRYADGKCDILPWNRRYRLDSAPFLSSILSGEEELLAAPMRLVGIENGKELIVTDVKSQFIHGFEEGKEVKACQYMQSARFVFNTTLTTEYDGMMDWHLTVATQGRSVAQFFGLAESDTAPRELTRLRLEIPLKRHAAISYQYAPQAEALIDGAIPDTSPALYAAGAIPTKSLSLPFIHQLFVGNDRKGFSVFFESDQDWEIEDEHRAIECITEKDAVVIRIHLLDCEPYVWRDKGEDGGIGLMPLSFRIGMQVTPIKPFPKNPYEEHNMHIDCFKKILQPYEEFLFSPFEDSAETAIDRMARLGVNTLYIHEKWNDIQNSPFLTSDTAARLKRIVSEAHKRGMKVIPYFGYEMSTLSPIYAEKAEEFLCSDVVWHWYRFPWQRAPQVCQNSGWQDVFVENVERLMDEFGFDGLYLDSIYPTRACRNEKHGCGYRDHNGVLHPTYPVFAVRNLMKRLCAIVEKRSGRICSHTFGVFPVTTMAFSHVMWEGESLQTLLMKGALNSVPEAHYRAVYTGRNLGIPVNMLCYSNPPAWTFREAMANTLPFGIIPKPVDTGEPLEDVSRLWKILDAFDIEHAVFKPYFESNILLSTEDVRLSCYETEDALLCLAANMKREPRKGVTVTLPNTAKNVVDAESGSVLTENADRITLDFDSFDYKILRILK